MELSENMMYVKQTVENLPLDAINYLFPINYIDPELTEHKPILLFVGFRNDTLNSLMLPEPLVATRESSRGTTESEDPSPSPLQVLLRSTTVTTESAVTTSYRPQSPGAIAGPAITIIPPWVPPMHHDVHHHGGTSRFGPYFEEGADGSNVTARLGSTVRLDCKIGMLQDKTVSHGEFTV
ncbi:hypothetical protein J437_LFUL014340 [Ladona fulva]|uniref:Uncharacterized protein n=1 Tax=Ladona fulva TaxID=123851 RepID=A0A8K0NX79_LADFU|nr:hypothetical protein J437_LFUL014340 [Ladona fulva]